MWINNNNNNKPAYKYFTLPFIKLLYFFLHFTSASSLTHTNSKRSIKKIHLCRRGQKKIISLTFVELNEKNNNKRRDKANEPVTIRKIQTNKYKHLYIQIYISVVNKLLYYADTHMYVYKHVPTTWQKYNCCQTKILTLH